MLRLTRLSENPLAPGVIEAQGLRRTLPSGQQLETSPLP